MNSAPFDVFLSYSRADQTMVERVAQALHAGGLRVFLDRWYLAAGHSWPEALEDALASCRAVVILLGPDGLGPWQQVTSMAPLFVAYSLAYMFSIALFLYLKVARSKNAYFILMSTYSFTLLFNIVFDQLIPKIANYWTKEEALKLFRNNNLKKVEIYSVAGNTWTVFATKK